MHPAPIRHAPKNLSECGSDGTATSSPITPARTRMSRAMTWIQQILPQADHREVNKTSAAFIKATRRPSP